MKSNGNKTKAPTRMRARRNPRDLQTIASLRWMIRRMQIAGLIFIIAGAFMPFYSPYYAGKQWKLLIGVSLPLKNVCIYAGCLMIAVSIFCFLRSYRCPKCGMLLALTPYTRISKCRSCGVEINVKDHYLSKGD